MNHPNIAAIHGLEESEGTHYLVLELVPGETLAERISRGPIPVEEAIEIATKIAEALEEAHEQGIVHRDLKPANIKQTDDGKIKVLDFGLAKAFAKESPEADSSMSPTLTRDATRVGVILGTAAYMSPEQAKGKRVDKRTDVWAFGAVVYEMLTGKRAFAGEDVSDTLAAVLRAEPGFDALPAETPASLRRALRLCLTKDVKQRFHAMGDVRLMLEGALEPEQPLGRAGPSPPAPPARVRTAAVLLLGVATGAAAIWFLSSREPSPKPMVRRAEIVLPPSERLFYGAGIGRPVIVSPQGTHLVYAARRESSVRQLFVRRFDTDLATPIPGTERALQFFFSPEGDWLGFFADGKLKKVALSGDVLKELCDVTYPLGGDWGRDEVIYFASSAWRDGELDPLLSGLFRIPSDGGVPEQLVTAEGEHADAAHRWPHILPKGDGVLYTSYARDTFSSNIVFQSLLTGESRVLIENGANPVYLLTGHILFRRDDALLGQRLLMPSATRSMAIPLRWLTGS